MSVTLLKQQFTACFVMEGNELIIPSFQLEERAVTLLEQLEVYALDAEPAERAEIMLMVNHFSLYLPMAQTI